MENLDLATIFWLIALGMVIGGAIKVVLGNKGLGLIPNIVGGVFGTVTVGVVGIALQFAGSMLFALMGSIAIVFIANVFNVQSDEGEH